MTARIAINGFGRMGRLVTRALRQRYPQLQIVAINDRDATAECAAHLLEFDSVHGRWERGTTHGPDHLVLDGQTVAYSQADRIATLDWQRLGIDLVLECTGAFRSPESLNPYFALGAGRVLVACPVKSGALNLVYGVNHHRYDPTQHRLLTAASCTTNCLAPVVKVLHEQIGIVHGQITTIHDSTNTQMVVDAPHKDLRRARAHSLNLIPTSTGSATAITLIYPELAGRLDGIAVRVPLLNASLTDCVFELARPVTAAEVNALFRHAAETDLAGILGYEERPLVSSDYLNDPRSAVIDAAYTRVVDGRSLKVLAWYDNEWGYVNRMADIAHMVLQPR